MIESFISTQKTSVQKLMAKKFRHFLTHKQDLNDLVMHALQVCNVVLASLLVVPPLRHLYRIPQLAVMRRWVLKSRTIAVATQYTCSTDSVDAPCLNTVAFMAPTALLLC